MLYEKPLEAVPPLFRLLLLVMLSILLGGLLSVVGMMTAPLVTGLDGSYLVEEAPADPVLVPLLWYMQSLTALGIFVFPALIFGYYWSFEQAWKPFGWSQKLSIRTYLMAGLTLLVSLPLVYKIYALNQQLPLPADLMQALQASESRAEATIGLLLARTDLIGLLINSFILVLLPAFGEEMLFRGIIQPSLQQQFRNPHLAIWITAILFSAMHMQWLGFAPRLLLGAFFGYLVFWTGSLLPAIFGHLLNNGLGVAVSFASENNWLSFDEDLLFSLPWWMLAWSITLTTIGFWLLHRYKNRSWIERLD
jgi:membrane protease YdiL (CAAX protease family)